MRLAAKVFLAASVAILVLVGVAAWSLVVVNRMMAANRAVATRTLPALRYETLVDDAIRSLVRVHTRLMVLDDASYGPVQEVRAADAERALQQLGPYLLTERETRLHHRARAALARYQRRAAAARAAPPSDRRTARRAATAVDPRARRHVEAIRALERTDRLVRRLQAATALAAERWQQRAGRLERRTWTAVMVALPLSVFGALAAAAFLSWRMGRSLRRIAAASAAVAGGSFPGPIDVRSRDEIGDLARAFDRMAERLGEVDRLKEELFAHVSHELRTPLTAVREATHLLRDRVAGPLEPRQERLVDIIGASSDRVLGMVNRILDWSRLRAGLSTMERRWIDLGAVAERAVTELRPQAEASRVAVVNGSNGHGRGAVTVYGDEERLLEVVVNLVSNGIKATPAGGVVRVRVESPSDDEAELVVEDTGVGIAADAVAHVFEPYWQAPGTQGGTGLGLAIVKGVVEAHGGVVSAESTPGEGSRFSVRVPRGKIDA